MMKASAKSSGPRLLGIVSGDPAARPVAEHGLVAQQIGRRPTPTVSPAQRRRPRARAIELGVDGAMLGKGPLRAPRYRAYCPRPARSTSSRARERCSNMTVEKSS
jgi:hypothetical protein